MRTLVIWLLAAATAIAQPAPPVADAQTQKQFENVYHYWRNAMVKKDANAWSQITAQHRQRIVKNRLSSERRAFPQALFLVPTAPPALTGLKSVQVTRKGVTAKCIYYGKIDFGVGGDPSENLMVIDFVLENTGWKYDIAEFVSLQALPEVRAELAKGDLSYIEKTSAFKPTGVIPAMQPLVPLAKYIGKVYVFCPGRSVELTVNGISHHKFGNAKEAELILGGIRDGKNTITYSAKGVPGGKGDEAISIRVYALSQVTGVKPIKLYEYQINEGQKLTPTGNSTFAMDAPTAAKLLGK